MHVGAIGCAWFEPGSGLEAWSAYANALIGLLCKCVLARGAWRHASTLYALTPQPPFPPQTDIKAPGLVAVHAEGAGANTAQVQLHLGRLALLGGAPGGGAPGGGGSAAHSSSAAPAPPPAPAPKPQPRPGSAGLQGYKPSAMPLTQYSVRNVPSRHLVLLGVTVQADVARLTGIARQHGTLEKYFCNPRKSAMTLHFSTTEAAKNMAREVEGHAVPGLQSERAGRGLRWCGRQGAGGGVLAALLRSAHPHHRWLQPPLTFLLPHYYPVSASCLPFCRPRPTGSCLQASGGGGSRRGSAAAQGRGKGSRAAAQGCSKGSQTQRAAAAVAVLCHPAQLRSASEEAEQRGRQVSSGLEGGHAALLLLLLAPPLVPLPAERCDHHPAMVVTACMAGAALLHRLPCHAPVAAQPRFALLPLPTAGRGWRRWAKLWRVAMASRIAPSSHPLALATCSFHPKRQRALLLRRCVAATCRGARVRACRGWSGRLAGADEPCSVR